MGLYFVGDHLTSPYPNVKCKKEIKVGHLLNYKIIANLCSGSAVLFLFIYSNTSILKNLKIEIQETW